MAIMRWNPIREMAAMQTTLDRMFDEAWRVGRMGESQPLALDVHETDNAYEVSAAIPGIKAENLNISVHDGVLTISGETSQETRKENEKTRALMLERSYGKFTRSIRLPQPVNTENIEATLDNGVLHLTLPKTEEAQPRQIPVRAGNGNNNNA